MRKVSPIFLAFWIVLLVLPSTTWARDRGQIRAQLFYWLPQIEGKVRVTRPGNPEKFWNLKQDLGIGRPKGIRDFGDLLGRAMGFEVQLAAKDYDLNIYGYRTKYQGSSTLGETLNFDGASFSTGTQMETTLKMEWLDVELAFHGYNKPPLSIGALMGVRILNFEFKLRSPSANESKKQNGVIPYMGLAAMMDFGQYFTIYGRIAGFSTDLEQGAFSLDDFYYVEGALGVMVHFGHFLSFGVEYRKMGMFVKVATTKASTEFRLKMGGDSQQFYHAFRFYLMLRF